MIVIFPPPTGRAFSVVVLSVLLLPVQFVCPFQSVIGPLSHNPTALYSLPQKLHHDVSDYGKQQPTPPQKRDDGKDLSPNEEATSRWLRWMQLGYHTPRGSDEIKMRDPIELGGLPRSDRYAARDWLHNTINLPFSAILKSIRFPVLSMTLWGFFVAIFRRWLLQVAAADVGNRFGASLARDLAAQMCLPERPHALMVSTLSLLLVFRTNSAYQRFVEGRKIWEGILNISRDLSRLAKLYEPQMGSSKLRRVQRLLAAFPYMLRFRVRPNSIMKKLDDPDNERDPLYSLILYQDHALSDSDAEAAAVASEEEMTGRSRRKPREIYFVDKRSLPWRLLASPAMEECARAQNRPLWICDRMAKELHCIPDATNFTARERLNLLGKVEKLSQAIGSCERIHQTVVPLNYARHALRSLTVWLLSLPFVMVQKNGLMTGPILFVTSWMLFGVYEIGYSIEDPFQGTLRLSILCDAIRRDVLGDEIIRNTAFVLEEKSTTSVGVEVKQDFDYEDEEIDDEEEEDGPIKIEDIFVNFDGSFIKNEKEAITIIDDRALEATSPKNGMYP